MLFPVKEVALENLSIGEQSDCKPMIIILIEISLEVGEFRLLPGNTFLEGVFKLLLAFILLLTDAHLNPLPFTLTVLKHPLVVAALTGLAFKRN